jgi:hypothetical protein
VARRLRESQVARRLLESQVAPKFFEAGVAHKFSQLQVGHESCQVARKFSESQVVHKFFELQEALGKTNCSQALDFRLGKLLTSSSNRKLLTDSRNGELVSRLWQVAHEILGSCWVFGGSLQVLRIASGSQVLANGSARKLLENASCSRVAHSYFSFVFSVSKHLLRLKRWDLNCNLLMSYGSLNNAKV